MLEELITLAKSNGRVCPLPQRWNELWEMLPNRKRAGAGWEPPLPLILAAWWDTPALMKMVRLEEHLRYAAEQGVLDEVAAFLRGLAENEWAHLGDF